MTLSKKAQDNREILRVLAVLSVLFVLAMAYVALSGRELPTVTRRPIAYVRVTWPETPIRFVLASVPLYFGILVVGIIGHAVFRAIFPRKAA